jgi:hypothetical protein
MTLSQDVQEVMKELEEVTAAKVLHSDWSLCELVLILFVWLQAAVVQEFEEFKTMTARAWTIHEVRYDWLGICHCENTCWINRIDCITWLAFVVVVFSP